MKIVFADGRRGFTLIELLVVIAYQNVLYNHYLPPNVDRPDCIIYHNPGWKAARSFHPGGINLLFCNGHLAFVKDTINLATSRTVSTRTGGEAISTDAL
jgi:pilin/secretion family protein with methylation motif/uncharacterized protein DUF1559